jgi:hypothetical protein
VEPIRDDTPTTELVKEALEDAKELVRLEVALAKREAREEARAARSSGIALGLAGALALLGVQALLVALCLAVGDWLFALVTGGVALVVSGIVAGAALRHVPKKPLDETRRRLQSDVRELKERAA